MKYVCVHGHFYQPPRENPSLEAIELQDSAYPYHDWNERVTAECYAPNAASRLLDGVGRITELANNYAKMSFNFGPTLLLWMKDQAPDVYEAILAADKSSREQFDGHGSAIAQAYNHMILPLAHPRDQETQVVWGVRDFVARFGRPPEGMWLPETAVSTSSLEALAAQGIQFTILAPRQAKRVRRLGSRRWVDVSGERIDPSRAYLVELPSKRRISVFFYDGPISQAVAFEGLLSDGNRFADRLLSGFSDQRTWPQLSHIATDGETYGHHHAFGEMGLTYALRCIEAGEVAKLTNYGQFLAMHPADHRVEIVEDTSWSCVHGVERWKSNCGCNSGGHPGWHQDWRAPLRQALDWLRDTLAEFFDSRARAFLNNPWAARNDYVDVVLDRSEQSLNNFFEKHAGRDLNCQERVSALKLLELQRHVMLMYTSCGWFFDELSGLETVQILHYAGRAIQLAREIGGTTELEGSFCERLRNAKSNLAEHRDGEEIYKKWVAPAVVTAEKVGAHYAISSLFETYNDKTRIYCYDVQRDEYSIETEGRVRLALGRARVRSQITTEEISLSFGVLHLGDHNITGGILNSQAVVPIEGLAEKLSQAFARADTAELIRILDEQFPQGTFSLHSLFRDEQRRIINLILRDILISVSGSFRTMYESHAPLIRFLNALSVPMPEALSSLASVALNSQLKQAMEKTEVDPAAVKGLLHEANLNGVRFDQPTLEFTMRKRIEGEAAIFNRNPADLQELKRFHTLLDIAGGLPFPIALWTAQNLSFPRFSTNPVPNGNPDANHQELRHEFLEVREKLHIRGPQ